jgi:flagellar biosynthesis protein FlhG
MAPVSTRRATRIAITSGKGGVGKTSVAVNLAVSLARLNHRVGLVDADFSLGNVDVLLGLTPDQHLGSVLAGTKSISEITVTGPSGVQVIPAGSGVRALTTFDPPVWTRLVNAIEEASRSVDFLILDTATGISDNVLDVLGIADYVIVLATYEPASVVDAYALIKLLETAAPQKPIGVFINSVRDAAEANTVFGQLSKATERFLRRSIRNDGYVLDDSALREAAISQTPLSHLEALSPANRCVRRLASRIVSIRNDATGPWGGPGGPFAAPTEAPCA